ncbi:MAG: SAM-dependent methyltransferase [Lachnospiraceae bacterium]|nr:SAM-dependent methyltransferase [Lachnospiraceae bacterium]
MENLTEQIRERISVHLIHMTISNPRQKGGIRKVVVRPVLLKKELYFQKSSYDEKKVYHENLTQEQCREQIMELLFPFRQVELVTETERLTALISKKGKATLKIKKEQNCRKAEELSHNRQKKYLIPEGKPVPYLIDLGVMTKEGKVVRSRYDKFRQINRFLEFIEDIIPSLPKKDTIRILDFGCGKSYLTFAMYEYLHEQQGLPVEMIGLDLKEDVMKHCNELAKKYHYENLKFLTGDIASYEDGNSIDMVVTLHACDTATDYALFKAVRWGAKVILSVPCCQHELNSKIGCSDLAPIMDYGLLKERFAALLTDGIRAKLLEEQGYQVQILEFIDMEHTPKNILIRAVYTGKKAGREPVNRCDDLCKSEGTLERLLRNEEDR